MVNLSLTNISSKFFMDLICSMVSMCVLLFIFFLFRFYAERIFLVSVTFLFWLSRKYFFCWFLPSYSWFLFRCSGSRFGCGGIAHFPMWGWSDRWCRDWCRCCTSILAHDAVRSTNLEFRVRSIFWVSAWCGRAICPIRFLLACVRGHLRGSSYPVSWWLRHRVIFRFVLRDSCWVDVIIFYKIE